LIVSETGGLAETLDRIENIPLKVRILSVFPKSSAGWLANLPVGIMLMRSPSYGQKTKTNRQKRSYSFRDQMI